MNSTLPKSATSQNYPTLLMIQMYQLHRREWNLETTCWHRLKGIDERYYILKGAGLVEVGDLPPQEVEVGDVVIIPALCHQRIKNIGQDDLVFLAICSPRFIDDAYEDLERVDQFNNS